MADVASENTNVGRKNNVPNRKKASRNLFVRRAGVLMTARQKAIGSRPEITPPIVRVTATYPGANATIVCGVTVGAGALVAAGAVVAAVVGAYALVAGNPARRLRWICACGGRLDESLTCGCGRDYRLVSEAEGLQLLSDPGS